MCAVSDLNMALLGHLDFSMFSFQSTFTCLKLAIETLEQGVKYVKS